MVKEYILNIAMVLALFLHINYMIYLLKHHMHMLQLNSYRNNRYIRWLHSSFFKEITIVSLFPLMSFLFYKNHILFVALWTSGYIFLYIKRKKLTQKKPFVITYRVKRLFLIIIIIYLILFFITYKISVDNQFSSAFILSFLAFSFLQLFMPYVVICANYIVWPIEKVICNWYTNDAYKIIRNMSNLTVIGITGSYGKTSTKFILNKMLLTKYNALMSPESFNTLLGITKVIRSRLKPIHNMFVVEMGAKQKNDIKQICKLVNPKIGLITTIGKQHLEEFKSIDNIVKAKSELIEALPLNGIAFVNGDDKYFIDFYKSTSAKVISFGILNDKVDYYAYDINCGVNGLTSFYVLMPNKGRIKLETRLLGLHNIYNILAASSIASELGIPDDRIKGVVRALEPIPHRLNLKTTNSGIKIIDNAFSSNPIGAKAAVDVLNDIEGKRKIIITPGMVELGDIEYEENKRFGSYAAKCCDYMILVGPKRTAAIIDGLKAERYPKEQIYIAENLDEANKHLSAVVETGDVVLYENDLPDTYN